MIFNEEVEQQITEAIRAAPDKPVILPDWAYRAKKSYVVISRDGLPVVLHRYLYVKLIGPLREDQLMRQACDEPKNVNPYLFTVHLRAKRGEDECLSGHIVAEYEPPPVSSRYRCGKCFIDARERYNAKRRKGLINPADVNAQKTECPHGHPYSEENTVIFGDGKRRCVTCLNDRKERRKSNGK